MTDYFDPMGLFKGSTAYASGTPQPEALTVEKLKAMVADMAASEPQEWMLISPQGKVFRGADPMRLVAHAAYRPFSYIDLPIVP